MSLLKLSFLASVFLIVLINQSPGQWQAQDPGYPTEMQVRFSHVVDTNIVWTVGGHERTKPNYHGFSKTTDCGLTWSADSIFAAGLDSFRFSSVFALDDSVAWVTMVNDSATVHRGRVFKTTDGGANWVHQATAFPDDPVLAHLPMFIYFYDENNGITVGYYGEHYITSDGGNQWTLVPQQNIPTLLGNERPFSRGYWSVGDSTTWYGTSKGRVFKTTDRGLSWSAFDVGLGEGLIFVSFKNELNGLATAPVLNKNIAKTTDGGETWQTLTNLLPVNSILIHVKGTENTFMYGCGDLPFFIGSDPGCGFTADDGNSWQFQSNLYLEPMFSADPATGWASSATDNKMQVIH